VRQNGVCLAPVRVSAPCTQRQMQLASTSTPRFLDDFRGVFVG